jgi:DNA replication protein DnaC
LDGQYKLDGEIHECDCKMQKALYRHYTVAGIGENYMRLDWEADFNGDPDAKKMVQGYVDRWRAARQNGLGLTLWSKELGTGKTFGATHVAKSLVKLGQRVQFIHFTDLISTVVWETLDDERHFVYLPWLVIDEVWFNPARDSEAKKAMFGENFERLIRNRTNQNLPTIITSNLSPVQFKEHWPRVASLLSSKQMPVEFAGSDFRLGDGHMEGIERMLNGETKPIS